MSTSDSSSSPEHILNLPKSPPQSHNLPPVQQMNRAYDAPDPNRIPQSIFTSKANAAAEWSVASNESLFSIQMAKSGELGNMFGNNPEYQNLGIPKDTIGAMQEAIGGPLSELGANKQDSQPQNGIIDENVETNANMNITPPRPPRPYPNFSNMSTPCESPASGVSGRISETSTNSHSSFAFPVLAMDPKPVRGEMTQKLIQNEPIPVEEPVPRTPETVKSPTHQSGSWFSCFLCCSFSR